MNTCDVVTITPDDGKGITYRCDHAKIIQTGSRTVLKLRGNVRKSVVPPVPLGKKLIIGLRESDQFTIYSEQEEQKSAPAQESGG